MRMRTEFANTQAMSTGCSARLAVTAQARRCIVLDTGVFVFCHAYVTIVSRVHARAKHIVNLNVVGTRAQTVIAKRPAVFPIAEPQVLTQKRDIVAY